MTNSLVTSPFLRFVIVGAAGFFVDGLILLLLISIDWSLLLARLGSFSCAVSVTWYCNRMWTFNKKDVEKARAAQQYGYYVTTQLLGAGINIAVFFLFINYVPVIADQPLIPLAAGSLAAMCSNYVLAKSLFIRRSRDLMQLNKTSR